MVAKGIEHNTMIKKLLPICFLLASCSPSVERFTNVWVLFDREKLTYNVGYRNGNDVREWDIDIECVFYVPVREYEVVDDEFLYNEFYVYNITGKYKLVVYEKLPQ